MTYMQGLIFRSRNCQTHFLNGEGGTHTTKIHNCNILVTLLFRYVLNAVNYIFTFFLIHSTV